jgi:hypothetical protein
MILDEAEKPYNKLTKEMVNTTITDYSLAYYLHCQCYRNLTKKNNDQGLSFKVHLKENKIVRPRSLIEDKRTDFFNQILQPMIFQTASVIAMVISSLTF